MGEQWSHRSGAQADTDEELAALQRAQDDLWSKLRGEVDPDRRMALLSAFSENRAEIERLTEELAVSGRPVGEPAVSYRVAVVDPEETAERLAFDASGELVPSASSARAHAQHVEVDPTLSTPAGFLHDNGQQFEIGDRHHELYEAVELQEEEERYEPRRADTGVFDREARTGQAQPHRQPSPPPVRNQPARTSQTPVVVERQKPEAPTSPGPDSLRRILLVLGGLGVVLGMAWFLLGRSSDDPPTSVASEVADGDAANEPAAPTSDLELGELVVGLRNLGLNGVVAERRGAVIYLVGTVPAETDRERAVTFAESIAPGQLVDGTELQIGPALGDAPPPPPASPRAASYQSELSRVVASTPIIFDVGQTALSELHSRILNSIAAIMTAYPEYEVTIVGFADGTGSVEDNREISLRRAESVKAYLVGLGVAEDKLAIAARGEETSSGSEALASLERRVEFEVVAPVGVEQAPGAAAPIRVAIIAPSARNDLAFTQSMVDAANLVAAERGNVEVAVTDSTFVPDDAAAAIRGYADEGYDLIVAHGSQFGSLLLEIAPQYPEVAFAWGTASDTFALPNVYAYDAAAHQGGYVLGTMSTLLSGSGVVGVIGPIEVGDAQLYVDGFAAGARASKPDATVFVEYTGSFSDLTLAAEAAQRQIDGGADVLTGSAQMVVGAVSVAKENGAVWFGTQANQSSLAPSLVAASQVYHWEVILQQIVADIDAGSLGGRNYTADLANGGIVIEFNPDYPLPEEVRRRADETIAGIIDGTIQVPIG
ncbi:MAG: BMP family ABC transporter substrate-binding protein [Acidimicrobiales bacterium]